MLPEAGSKGLALSTPENATMPPDAPMVPLPVAKL
jgi:hypothetical protein